MQKSMKTLFLDRLSLVVLTSGSLISNSMASATATATDELRQPSTSHVSVPSVDDSEGCESGLCSEEEYRRFFAMQPVKRILDDDYKNYGGNTFDLLTDFFTKYDRKKMIRCVDRRARSIADDICKNVEDITAETIQEFLKAKNSHQSHIGYGDESYNQYCFKVKISRIRSDDLPMCIIEIAFADPNKIAKNDYLISFTALASFYRDGLSNDLSFWKYGQVWSYLFEETEPQKID